MPLVRSILAQGNPVPFIVVLAILFCSFPAISSGQTQSTTQMNGAFTAGAINNQSQVDGLTNPSLASATTAPQCSGATSTSPTGCVIWDGLPELFQAWPLFGGNTYHLSLGKGAQGGAGKGIFYTTVPIVLGSSQIVGSGRAKTGSGKTSLEDGSTGTVIRACDGNGVVTTSPDSVTDNACTFGDPTAVPIYFPNAPPTPPALDGVSFTSTDGALNPGTKYYWQIAWVVNLATGCDSRYTSDWPDWPGNNKLIYAGMCIKVGSNTQMALNQGHTVGSGSPSWMGIGVKTQDGDVFWLNIGPYSSTDQTPNGTPGISLPSTEKFATIVALGNSIRLNSGGNINVDPSQYSPCSGSGQYNSGDYVVAMTDHLYRAIGTNGMTQGSSCTMSTVSGSQTADSNNNSTNCGANPPIGNCLYWQEVGSVASGAALPYLPVVGYLVYASTSTNTEVIASSIGCNATVQVGALTACKINTPYILKSLDCATGCFHVPVIDTTHPLIVLGERMSSPSRSLSTFMSRVQDLTADANNIAGEAVAYIYAQEQSGAYGVNALSGSEASVAAIGPGTQNSMLYDFVVSNPNNDGSYYHQQRKAGVYLDARDGEPMKTVFHGTITPYNNPSTTLGLTPATSVPAGIAYIGGDDITIESVHTENVYDGILCDGDSVYSNTKANCYILSTDPAAGNIGKENNTVHLGPMVNSALVNTVKGMSTSALMDDTVPYSQSGQYVLGTSVGGFRTRLYPQANPQSLVGTLLLGSNANAGAIGLVKGGDTTGWPTTNTTTIEAPNASFNSYRLTLPAGAASGIFQGSDPSGSSLVTGTFSGDANHATYLNAKHADLGYTILCPASASASGGCDTAGLYRVSFYLFSSSVCSGGSASVGPIEIKYTDYGSTPKSDVVIPLFSSGTISSSITLGNGSSYAWGSATIWSAGFPSDIKYQVTGYQSSCTSGSADYDLAATVEQLRGPPVP